MGQHDHIYYSPYKIFSEPLVKSNHNSGGEEVEAGVYPHQIYQYQQDTLDTDG